MTDEPAGRRRSRRRATARRGPPRETQSAAGPAAEPTATPPAAADPAAPPTRTPARPESRGRRPAAKAARGDRDLAGSGSSQVGPTGAMRARDLNRPTEQDLAEAEAGLVIVRRHWSPAAEQSPPARPARRRRS